jgi:predicted PurR-regulated permease PerM
MVVALLLLGAVFFPLWRPIVVGLGVAASLSRLTGKIAARIGGRRGPAIGAVTVGTLALLVGPLGYVVTVALQEAMVVLRHLRDVRATQGVAGIIAELPQGVQRMLGENAEATVSEKLDGAAAYSVKLLSGTLDVAGDSLVFLIVMIVTMVAALSEGPAMVRYLIEVSPLTRGATTRIIVRFARVSKAVLSTTIAVATLQTALAMAAYWLAGAPQLFLFGVATWFGACIPGGLALVTLPLAGILASQGHPTSAGVVAGWNIFFVGQVDNIIKPRLMKGAVKVHGAVLFLAMLGALTTFGMIGLLIGPLAITLFLTVTRIQRDEARRAAAAAAAAAAITS